MHVKQGKVRVVGDELRREVADRIESSEQRPQRRDGIEDTSSSGMATHVAVGVGIGAGAGVCHRQRRCPCRRRRRRVSGWALLAPPQGSKRL